MVRGLYGTVVNWKEDEREEASMGERDVGDATRSAVVASAGVVVVGALILRIGGRAALVSLLGLDFVAEMGIGDQVDQVVATAATLGPLTLVGFVAAWCVAKVFLVDVLSIALAFSSGILFGGVFEGAFLSAFGATIGSLCAFQLSRGALQTKADEDSADGVAEVVSARVAGVVGLPAAPDLLPRRRRVVA